MEPAKRAVLIVEDESIVAHDLQQTLSDLGFDAFAIASSADEAMARADERRPDVALVDVRIKGRLDGIKTAQLLEDRFGVPIVYLTAHADDATLERAMKTHPLGYLLKPVKPAALRSAIEIALHHHEGPGPRPATPSSDAPHPSTRKVRSPTTQAVRRELKKVLGSADFDAPRRSLEFLRFVVEETLAGRGESISQTTIATKVFGRKDDFDAIVDPIVRIQAGRLRRSLERYYLLSGAQDPVRIELPRGTYVPVFRRGGRGRDGGNRRYRGGKPGAHPRRAEAAVGKPSGGWPTLVFTRFEAPEPAETQEVALHAGEELALDHGVRGSGVAASRGGGRTLADGPCSLCARRTAPPGGRGPRLSARLVDRTTGEQVWGDDYLSVARRGQWSGSPNDAARVIAARVGAEEGIVVQVLAAERRKSGRPCRRPMTRSCSPTSSFLRATRRSFRWPWRRFGSGGCRTRVWPRLDPARPALHGQLLVRGDPHPHADRRGDCFCPARRARGSREPNRALRTGLGAADQGRALGRQRRWSKPFAPAPAPSSTSRSLATCSRFWATGSVARP